MEINKQLFEDVLSGKLKGTFILRNKIDIETNDLIRNVSNSHYVFPYKIYDRTYMENGLMFKSMLSEWDIIDFIPYTNMKENKLTIEIPDNKVVDWDESKKQNKIVLKDNPLTYEDVCKKLFKNIAVYYTTINGKINFNTNTGFIFDPNDAPSKHQLECILAKNKLANIAVYLNNGWKPIKGNSVWIIEYDCYLGYHASSIQAGSISFNSYGLVVFKSIELAQQAIEILGEETIKLALEPLGI